MAGINEKNGEIGVGPAVGWNCRAGPLLKSIAKTTPLVGRGGTLASHRFGTALPAESPASSSAADVEDPGPASTPAELPELPTLPALPASVGPLLGDASLPPPHPKRATRMGAQVAMTARARSDVLMSKPPKRGSGYLRTPSDRQSAIASRAV